MKYTLSILMLFAVIVHTKATDGVAQDVKLTGIPQDIFGQDSSQVTMDFNILMNSCVTVRRMNDSTKKAVKKSVVGQQGVVSWLDGDTLRCRMDTASNSVGMPRSVAVATGNLKVNYTDTPLMLAPYALKFNTYTQPQTDNLINVRVVKSDSNTYTGYITKAMYYAGLPSLSGYATTASLAGYATTVSLASYATTNSLQTASVNLLAAIPTNNNQLSNGANYTTSVGLTPTSRTLTINGTTQDLSANRTFTVTATPYVPTPNSVTRSIASSNYTISTTLQAYVNYTIQISCTATIGGAASGSVTLQYSTNSGSTWNTIGTVANSNTVTLAVALNSVTVQTASLSGYIPANALVRMVSATTGTTTNTYLQGYETF